ncbi:MAG: hypothetical protein PHE29_07805 [Tissierellia bacterium]|nr:hypothetical protein [Tissierellia bacterium]
MDTEPHLIGDLVEPGEKIAIYEDNLYGAYQGKPFYDGNGGWLLEQEYYCSRDISSQVEKISEKTGIYSYKGNTDLISVEDFKKYLTEQKAWCVEARDVYSVEHLGNIKKALAWGLEADGMNVYKVSIIKSIFAVLQTVFFILLGFFILLILYYKIFIYIVFGNRKR